MKVTSIVAVLGLILAALGAIIVKFRNTPPFHVGEEWEAFLKVYDKILKNQFEENNLKEICISRSLSSRFGSTQVHACGNSSNPAVFLMHGMSSCSLMYHDWLVPTLKENHYAITVDTLCDIGRSNPLNGNSSNCPQGAKDITEWVLDIKKQLEIEEPIDMVGYSYGSFISATVASNAPTEVDRVVLMAPAAVVAPIEPAWLFRALAYGIAYSLSPTESFKQFLRDWFFGYMFAEPQNLKNMKNIDLLEASGNIKGAPQGIGDPLPWNISDLAELNKNTPTMLIVGKDETVINATKAIDNANEAGIKVQAYDNSGHVFLAEWPREPIIDVINNFLAKSS